VSRQGDREHGHRNCRGHAGPQAREQGAWRHRRMTRHDRRRHQGVEEAWWAPSVRCFRAHGDGVRREVERAQWPRAGGGAG